MTGFEELAKQTALYPKESSAAVKSTQSSLLIGLPKEVSLQENRIALTPEAVAILVRNGHEVRLETTAGVGAKFSDSDYSEAGAQIAYSAKEVYEAANLILKIEPLVENEFDLLKQGTTVISALNLPAHERPYFEKLNERHITGIGYEFIEDKAGGLPVIRSMSEMAGSIVLLIAGEYLSSANGRGIILGGITGVPPTKVVFIGAGTVAEFATRAALGLGADVKVFDKDLYKLQRFKYAIGTSVYTSILDSDTLSEAIERADVVIGALRAEDGLSPVVVTDTMVSRMKPHSVIIDVAIDQGGNFETSHMTSHKNPTYRVHDVIHFCVPNIAARVPHTASMALSNVFLPFLLQTGTIGGIEAMMYANRWFMKGVYCHKGTLTNAYMARKFNMRFKDLELFLGASRF